MLLLCCLQDLHCPLQRCPLPCVITEVPSAAADRCSQQNSWSVLLHGLYSWGAECVPPQLSLALWTPLRLVCDFKSLFLAQVIRPAALGYRVILTLVIKRQLTHSVVFFVPISDGGGGGGCTGELTDSRRQHRCSLHKHATPAVGMQPPSVSAFSAL